MESNNTQRNLGKLDPIALGKLISKFIHGERKIYVSGRNQVKIFCESREDANTLLTSTEVSSLDLITFIPDSLIHSKGTINVKASYPVSEIINNLDEESRLLVASATRKQQRDSNNLLDSIEIKFKSKSIPKTLYIYSVAHHVAPIIPQPKRCHNCQLFGHVKAQCRSSKPIC